jgi:HAD superfamily hydrolase (TIGR01509 family)
VLLDVGNVLVCDDPALALLYRMIHDAARVVEPAVTFGDLMAERERLIGRGEGRPWRALAAHYVGDTGWRTINNDFLAVLDGDYERYNIPVPGVRQVLAELSEHYRLAVAANQARACRVAFERLGWMPYFSEFWISGEVRLGKPSPEFFTSLLSRIQCAPGEAVMIGDRIDADIRPAKTLGLRTVQVCARFDCFRDGAEDARDRMYRESLERIRVGGFEPTVPGDRPDALVTSLASLPETLASL